MSLSDVRIYFQDRILEVDSDFRAHPDGFNIDNIPNTNFHKTYHIFPGDLSSSAFTLITDDNMVWTVNLFFKAGLDVDDAIDNAVDIANSIRLGAINHVNAMVGDEIKNVIFNSMSVNDIGTNDNLIRIELQFTVRLAFCP